MKRLLSAMLLASASVVCQADQAVVIKATAKALGENQYQINVTLKHGDEGWQHYANAWQVQTEAGQVLGTRTLHHPHVDEQPFTRGLTLGIDPAIKTIFIQAVDRVHGANPKRFEINID